MSNISKAFENGKAFIPFITCGDPDIGTSIAVAKEMARAGADIIELGIPFSDPTAGGPILQASSERALSAGTTTDKVFEMVKDLRKDVTIPIIFVTYANVVFSYGAERFMSKCKDIGVEGIILLDIPYEEQNEFLPVMKEFGIAMISLIAPTSENRISMIASEAEGFIYIDTSLSDVDIKGLASKVKVASDLPCVINPCISTPDQARTLAQYADGISVESAVVEIVAEYGKEAAPHVYDYVKSMKDAIR